MFKRLQGNYQLAIISLFGASATLGILPFAVYRWLTGAYSIAILDAAIALGISTVVTYAWRTGRTRRPGYLMAMINNSGAVLSALMLGDAGLLWIYAVLLSNFFLLPRTLAVFVALVEIGGLAAFGVAFESNSHMASFVVSSLVVSTLALILAHWTDNQHQQLRLLATHDPLTSLLNRRAMENDLEQAILDHQRNCMPYGLAIVDLDHFKAVNDRHGHGRGDAVLVAFADLLRGSLRKVDRTYRFGGEEFLLLLPGTCAEGLVVVTETLRAHTAAKLQGPDGKLTASFGAAAVQRGDTVQSWLARADQALYRAKGLGRNRACVDEGEAGEAPTPPQPAQLLDP